MKNAIGWQSEAESRYQRHLKFDPPCGRVQLLLLKRNKNSVYRERGRRCRYFEKIPNADAGKYFHRPILNAKQSAICFWPKGQADRHVGNDIDGPKLCPRIDPEWGEKGNCRRIHHDRVFPREISDCGTYPSAHGVLYEKCRVFSRQFCWKRGATTKCREFCRKNVGFVWKARKKNSFFKKM